MKKLTNLLVLSTLAKLYLQTELQQQKSIRKSSLSQFDMLTTIINGLINNALLTPSAKLAIFKIQVSHRGLKNITFQNYSIKKLYCSKSFANPSFFLKQPVTARNCQNIFCMKKR